MPDRKPKAPARRGRCDSCGKRQRLRRDGRVGTHDNGGPGCPGTGKPPRPVRFPGAQPDCGECALWLYGQHAAMLIEACASVGMETGASAGEILMALVTAFHDGDHEEMRDA